MERFRSSGRLPYHLPMPPVSPWTFTIFLVHILQTDLLPSTLSWMTTILNSSNNSKEWQVFHTQKKNIRKLFVRSFRKQRYSGDTLSILCVKIFKANCANIVGNHYKIGKIKTGLFAQIPAVVICDAWSRHDSWKWFWLVNTYTDACHAMRRWKTAVKTLVSGFSLPDASTSYPASKKTLTDSGWVPPTDHTGLGILQWNLY